MSRIINSGWRAIAIAAGLTLATQSARADDKADAAKMVAEWNAIPDGTVAPSVADALAFESQTNFAPKPQEVVYEMPIQRPREASLLEGEFNWVLRATLSQVGPNLFKLESLPCNGTNLEYTCSARALNTLILDRTGFIVASRQVGPMVNSTSKFYNYEKMSTLLVSARTAPDSGPAAGFSNMAFTLVTLGSNNTPSERDSYSCDLVAQGGLAKATCKLARVARNELDGKISSRSSAEELSYVRDSAFNMYFLAGVKIGPISVAGNGCFQDSCEGNSHKIVDYRLPGKPWHSQEVSATLSPADKQKATALFSAGFDSCKTGDFTGGMALLQRGLATDPANYQGNYTLADCARSAWINNQNDNWEKSVAFYYYRRTVDLAPDSPEGVKAQGRIDSGLN